MKRIIFILLYITTLGFSLSKENIRFIIEGNSDLLYNISLNQINNKTLNYNIERFNLSQKTKDEMSFSLPFRTTTFFITEKSIVFASESTLLSNRYIAVLDFDKMNIYLYDIYSKSKELNLCLNKYTISRTITYLDDDQNFRSYVINEEIWHKNIYEYSDARIILFLGEEQNYKSSSLQPYFVYNVNDKKGYLQYVKESKLQSIEVCPKKIINVKIKNQKIIL